MAEEQFIDPESIPLPDDILAPDEIPLPPDDCDDGDAAGQHHVHQVDTPTASSKRRIPDDEIRQVNQTNHDRQHQASQHKKKARSDSKSGQQEIMLVMTDELKKEQELMNTLLGFSNFDTTKGKMVPGNQSVGAVHVVKKRRYRQYMNRKGGFNRPLDKVP